MTFNATKCKVLHIGNNNDHYDYLINGTKLLEVNEEKYLGVTITRDLKSGYHCTEVVEKANKLIGFIGRTFDFKMEKSSSPYSMLLYVRTWNIAFNFGHRTIEKILKKWREGRDE